MPFTVFYAWQSDSPNNLCRRLIRKALEDTAKRLQLDPEIRDADRDSEIEIDQDIRGVPGSPSIADTILEKIAASNAFVADLTLTAQGAPNPNVTLEYGYALAKLGPDKLVGVVNEAFGRPEDLPFDLRHRRHLKYRAGENDDPAAARQQLAGQLAGALRPILRDAKAREPQQEAPARPAPWIGRFLDEDTEKPVTLAPGPALYLNCEPPGEGETPLLAIPMDWRRNIASGLRPLAPPDLLPEDAARLRRLRSERGIGAFLPDPAAPERAIAASMVTREGSFHGVWCGCAESPEAGLAKRLDEDRLAETLVAGLKGYHSAFEGAGLLADVHFSSRSSEVRVRLDGVRDLPLMTSGGSLAGPLLVGCVATPDEASMGCVLDLGRFFHALREAAGEDGEAARPRSLRGLSTWPERRVRF